MGSGTTGVAAILESRCFIGIEISPEYFQVAEMRLKEAVSQPSLFTPSNNCVNTDKGDSARQSSFIHPDADTAKGALS